MNERQIIMVAGQYGSGKSTLARHLAHTYHKKLERELDDHPHGRLRQGLDYILPDKHAPLASHISIGQYIRDIYTGKTKSFYADQVAQHLDSADPHDLMEDNLINGLTYEAFLYHNDAQLVFLDGTPRRASQVDDLRAMAGDMGYTLSGMLVTEVDLETAKARCLKRERTLGGTALSKIAYDSDHSTEEIAAKRAEVFAENMPAVFDSIKRLQLPVESIWTAGPKDATRHLGEVAVERILSLRAGYSGVA